MRIHYLLGIVGTILYVISHFKMGITTNRFASIYRLAQFIPWNKAQKVYINYNKMSIIFNFDTKQMGLYLGDMVMKIKQIT